MSSADIPGTGPEGSGQASEDAGEQVHTQLVEALVLLLIEKGVLTQNDALSIVGTVAQVQRGKSIEGGEPRAQAQAAIRMLYRMFRSFEALADSSGARVASGDNVHQLRPPIYEARPEFPGDD